MADALKVKVEVFQEVEPILELLREVHGRLDALPRSTVAARQLHLIISRLATWKTAYEPLQAKPKADVAILPTNPSAGALAPPSRYEIDLALKSYRRNSYFGLSEREKFCIEYFDKTYHNRQA